MRTVKAAAGSLALCALAVLVSAASACASRPAGAGPSTTAAYSVARSASASETSVIASQSLALVTALASRDGTRAALVAGEAVDVAVWRDETFGAYSRGDLKVVSLRPTDVKVDSSSPPAVWMASADLVFTADGQRHAFPVYLIGMVDGGAMRAQEVSRFRPH